MRIFYFKQIKDNFLFAMVNLRNRDIKLLQISVETNDNGLLFVRSVLSQNEKGIIHLKPVFCRILQRKNHFEVKLEKETVSAAVQVKTCKLRASTGG